MANWSPEQYEKFKGERSRPFFDLMDLVRIRHPENAVDLGCGTGELTRVLFDQVQASSMWGIDSSAEMLAKAESFGGGGLEFHREDIAKFRPKRPLNLLFSNAALQWVPDHETLFPSLLSGLAPGGEFAVQMPTNFDHPSHRLAAEVANEMFPDLFSRDERKDSVLDVGRYAEILAANGFQEQICRVQVYGHRMASGLDVIEWTKGTLLTFYQDRLTAAQFAAFLTRYQETLAGHIGAGSYFYAFKRILLWGVKA